jgi:hypothetical protein
MKTSATNRKLRVILRQISEGTLIPRPDFQRRLVWLNKHKNSFIRTVLGELPFPEIYIAAGDVNEDTAESTELLVDGQQRISTLYQYFSGSTELKLERDIIPYVKLSSEDKQKFLEYEVVIRDIGNVSIELIKDIFQRINSTSYSLNAMEINNSRYDGEMKQFCFDLAKHAFFEDHKIFSANDVRRMDDTRFCLTLIISIMSSYFNRDDLFEEFLSKYDECFDEKDILKEQLDNIFSFIDATIPSNNSRIFKKADLLTFIVELHRIVYKDNLDIKPYDISGKLEEFYYLVDKSKDTWIDQDINDYYQATLQASNDRGNRIIRGEVLRALLLR